MNYHKKNFFIDQMNAQLLKLYHIFSTEHDGFRVKYFFVIYKNRLMLLDVEI